MYEGTKPARANCTNQDDLDTAFGAMRDGLAALTNLKNILHSPRIGWRPVAQATEEMRPVTQSLRDAFGVLIGDLSARTNEPPCLAELSTFTTEHLDRLDQELSAAISSGIRAKTRLHLEAEVVRIEAFLDTVRELIELVSHATTPCLTELDPRAVVQGSLELLAPQGSEPVVQVSVSNSMRDLPVVSGNPHTLIPLLATSIGLLASIGVDHILLSVRTSQDAGLTFSLASAPPPSRRAVTTPCLAPRVIPLTEPAALLAASTSGSVMTFSRTEERISLRVPPGKSSSVLLRSSVQPRHH